MPRMRRWACRPLLQLTPSKHRLLSHRPASPSTRLRRPRPSPTWLRYRRPRHCRRPPQRWRRRPLPSRSQTSRQGSSPCTSLPAAAPTKLAAACASHRWRTRRSDGRASAGTSFRCSRPAHNQIRHVTSLSIALRSRQNTPGRPLPHRILQQAQLLVERRGLCVRVAAPHRQQRRWPAEAAR